MYTKRNYSVKDMAWWTRQDTALLLFVALIPVIVYEVLDQKWLQLPWLPIAVVGTAVAFIISFQNNATYDRVWEARKIWGGIVNTSRAWGVVVNDFITTDFTDEDVSDGELGAIRRELVFRHLAWLTSLRHAMRQPRPWEHFVRHPSNLEWRDAIAVREHRYSLEEELEPYLSEEAHFSSVETAAPPANPRAHRGFQAYGDGEHPGRALRAPGEVRENQELPLPPAIRDPQLPLPLDLLAPAALWRDVRVR
ncbi:MAG: hypothetical protein JRE73_15975 [Deltaproteobacteria bacterium]|nr:hypothetical protein [Deltaproteobacteria bacterium]